MSQTPEQIRQDQMRAGRTLSVREGYEPKPRIKQWGNKGGQRPQRPVMPAEAKGHDAVLKKAQDEKRSINITLMSGDKFSGTIIDRDKYTITVNDSDGFEVVIYKHAIELFIVTAPSVVQ